MSIFHSSNGWLRKKEIHNFYLPKTLYLIEEQKVIFHQVCAKDLSRPKQILIYGVVDLPITPNKGMYTPVMQATSTHG